MNCPKCDAEMEKIVYADVEVDRCTGCHGIWFDNLEHEKLKAVAGSDAIDDGDPAVGKRFNELDRIDCPVCHSPMVRMVDARQRHIWYESCAVCSGVFFDAGEFCDFKHEHLFDRLKDLLTPPRPY